MPMLCSVHHSGWPEGWSSFVQAIWYPTDQLDEIAFNLNGPVTSASPSNIYVSPVAKLTIMAGCRFRQRRWWQTKRSVHSHIGPGLTSRTASTPRSAD
jgi:hypothetical protein